jgi:hypothetical protein
MLEGIILSVVLAYVGGYTVIKVVHWFDEQQAKKIRRAREQRHLQQFGRAKSHEEIMEEARANVFPD